MTALHAPSALRRYMRHGMLPQLAAFEAVMRLGSATRAAEALCIAQPTLSGHLRKLGQALGVPLFRMQGKHLVPTDAATVLRQASHEVFAAFERCERGLAGCRSDLSADSATRAAGPPLQGERSGPSPHSTPAGCAIKGST
jgi:DNA-binding transcriptional LysR family regulator